MIRAKVKVNTKVLEEIEINARDAAKVLKGAMKRISNQVIDYALKEARIYPANSPALPFVWSYDKEKQNRARRWYFANKVPKGSAGGRYQRTGALGQAWQGKVETTPTSGTISIVNPTVASDYVYGAQQVPSHYLTGWQPLNGNEQRVSDYAQDLLIDAWSVILDL